MKNDIKNLYQYLNSKGYKSYRTGWYQDYKKLAEQLQKLKETLLEKSESTLATDGIFTGTDFENKEAFLKKMFANTSNGVSSNGQSIFSEKDYQTVKNDTTFSGALVELIKDPSKANHDKFAKVWKEKLGKNNPVQTNRASAACNLALSSTVDNGKFKELFNWLQQYNYLEEEYQGEANWYDQNIFLVEYCRRKLEDVEDDPYWINIFIWAIYVNLANPFRLKKQLVKYGAPGTGKTYQAKETSKLQFDIWKSRFPTSPFTFDDVLEVIQFHPSYSYEDFMEGLRPRLDTHQQAQLQLQNGVFKSFCIRAGRWEVDYAKLNIEKTWEELTIHDLTPHRDQLTDKYWQYILELKDTSLKVTDVVPPYFMIIDEINRAELSRVFGELMLCLEYRGTEGKVKTQYNQLNTPETSMLTVGDSYLFFVPHNVYLIATMNTIDRSVESFDFALRRRFKWEEVAPDTDLLRYHLQEYNSAWVNLADSLKKLNEAIENEPVLGKDYCIGHAYLWNLPYAKNLGIREVRKSVWEDSIASLLEEYLRGTGKTMETFKEAFLS